ncbi:hypothetical protein ACFQ0K_03145 [Nocardioides caeni]|uniref:Uncharacterized protein n=1 Tax=Nocardioides caeni TaxID=574700 RepID=A0A4S8NS90_9ACTN|nr:hypothetical protein [Nocardioides caeni]THV18194.1 hypothetical protein E9934_00650 [Nocardioides caeni]
MTAVSENGRASGSRMGAGSSHLPRAGEGNRSGIAPLRNNNAALLQVVLFWAGAIMLPLGIVIIILGWYGAANTPYEFDQMSYVISGGMLGLGLTFVGGFLYFGAWLARIAADERESSKRLADTLLLLAEVTAANVTTDDGGRDLGAIPVVAGNGTTIHRRDCSLIAHRDDLTPVGENTGHLSTCRVCRPGQHA